MINITLEQLLNSAEALKKLSMQSLKARPAYMTAKLIKAADTEISNFNEIRMNLIKKYGEKDASGELILDENQNVRIYPDKLNDFNNEINELLKTNVEINTNKILLTDIEEIKFTPNEIAQLEEFIDIG